MKKYNGTVTFYTINYPYYGYNGGEIEFMDSPHEDEFNHMKAYFLRKYGEDFAVEFRPANPKPGLRGFAEGEEEVILCFSGEQPEKRKVTICFESEVTGCLLKLTEEEFLRFDWIKDCGFKYPLLGLRSISTGWFTDEQLWEGASHGLQVKNPFRDQWVTVWEPCM